MPRCFSLITIEIKIIVGEKRRTSETIPVQLSRPLRFRTRVLLSLRGSRFVLDFRAIYRPQDDPLWNEEKKRDCYGWSSWCNVIGHDVRETRETKTAHNTHASSVHNAFRLLLSSPIEKRPRRGVNLGLPALSRLPANFNFHRSSKNRDFSRLEQRFAEPRRAIEHYIHK